MTETRTEGTGAEEVVAAETAAELRDAPTMVDVFTDVDIDTELATNPAGVAIVQLAEDDPRVVTLSADLSTTIATFRERWPERYIELGIAETNSISISAGLAASGFLPYIYSMSPFGILKTAEQLRTDAAYNHLPVRLVGRLTGLAMGWFGTSHHAVEDVSIARAITGMTVVSPADSQSTISLFAQTKDHPGPVYLRIAEGAEPVYEEPPTYERGTWLRAREGSDVSIIAHGLGVGIAVRAAAELEQDGVSAEVWDAAYLKPYDEQAILEAAGRTGRLVTVEDHNVVGGLASIVAETLGRHGADGVSARLAAVALPDEDLEVGAPAELYDHYGINVAGVVARAKELAGR
ncbi:transketolase family protein [Nocardioides sp. DS6]|uniref:Transketolase family protein n=1 Tax=Nocardioides eburneus TaxID=3231482 RepID=A0ABV3SUX2_9ACTN